MLNQRKKKILKEVVEEYIKQARPISSATLAKKTFSDLSPATIRNELLDLTKMGFLQQPHPSAGRVPTLEGFRFFLENYLPKDQDLPLLKDLFLEIEKQELETRKKIKGIAKKLAEVSQETVVVAFSKEDFYYTGLSRLFRQPEFQDLSLVHNISEIVDHLDETMKDVFDKINEMKILIGRDNPFGDKCATIFDKIEVDGRKVVIGLLGPLRMDYKKNIALIKSVKKILK
jgi:heat-inducible transcriptional repressor